MFTNSLFTIITVLCLANKRCLTVGSPTL